MEYLYKTKGVCPAEIVVKLNGDLVEEVKFSGGCNGNLKAISKVVKGMTVDEASEMFEGITCGMKSTSCSDQMVQALKEARANG